MSQTIRIAVVCPAGRMLREEGAAVAKGAQSREKLLAVAGDCDPMVLLREL